VKVALSVGSIQLLRPRPFNSTKHRLSCQ